MKWLPANGSTQANADGRYVIVNATSKHWISYELTPYGTGKDLGTSSTDEEARQVCEEHEVRLLVERKRA